MAAIKTTKPGAPATSEQSPSAGRLHDAYRASRQRLMNLVRRHGASKEDSEDLAQAVAMKTLRRERTEPIADIKGYLYVAARNAARDLHTERSWESGGRTDLLSVCATVAQSAEDTVTTHDLLVKALEQLPPEQMQALCLAKIDGLTHQQIATEMNISPRRVRTLLAKALDHCVEVCRAAGGAS